MQWVHKEQLSQRNTQRFNSLSLLPNWLWDLTWKEKSKVAPRLDESENGLVPDKRKGGEWGEVGEFYLGPKMWS